MRPTQGYLILALGPARYVEMAANLAASIRVMDPTRGICIVHDERAQSVSGLAQFFTDFVELSAHSCYSGFMNKLRVFDLSPYAQTMVVDADCLLVKQDVGRYWNLVSDHFFAVPGVKETSGRWKGVDIQSLLVQENAPYLIRMNSGVFYFDKSAQARTFFSGLNRFYLQRRDYLAVGLHRGVPSQTDEIYFGIWMGKCGMSPCCNGGKFGADSWMVSTWRGFGMQFDPWNNLSRICKPRYHMGGIPCPIFGWDTLSPTFAHFILLRPTSTYRRLAAEFRREALRSHERLVA